MPRLDDFTRGYIECALWVPGGGDDLDELTLDELPDKTLARLVADARDFQTSNAELLARAVDAGRPMSHLGHDFWLTRNRHGTGFWDRGLGDIGRELTANAHAYGSALLYVGDDGRVYHA